MRRFGKAVTAALIAAQAVPAAMAQPTASGAAPTLPKAPRDAAMTCYWATAAGMADAKDQTGVIASAVWYLLEYLRAEKVPGDPLEHIQAMSSENSIQTRSSAGIPPRWPWSASSAIRATARPRSSCRRTRSSGTRYAWPSPR